MAPMAYSGALAETDSCKNLKSKIFRLPFNVKEKTGYSQKVHRFASTILPNSTPCTVSLYRWVGTDRSGARRLRDGLSKGRIVQGTQKPRDALCKGFGDEITLHPKCSRVDTNY
jgi:hypothetical protein